MYKQYVPKKKTEEENYLVKSVNICHGLFSPFSAAHRCAAVIL